MFFLLPSGQIRPSVLEKNKDEQYHLDFARYCIGQANNVHHSNWLSKIARNKAFYRNEQWIDQEDVDTFLKDDTNNDRNIIPIVDNIIKPMVVQYRGNAIRMNINYRAKSKSPMAINRRETQLAQMLHLTKEANNPENPFGEEMKKRFPIGKNEGETSRMFKNLYVDKYEKAMNNLLKFVSERNKFDSRQDRIAEELALSGLAVMKTFEYAGHQEFQEVPSENFFFDRTARRHDLSDAFFQGEVYELSPTEIYEMFPDVTPEQRTLIDNYSRYYSGQDPLVGQNKKQVYNGRIPVYFVYWRDGQSDEFGYVKDEFGYDYLTRINYVYEGQKEPKYTDKDLVKVTSIKSQKLLGGNLKRRLYYDVLRTAVIIPREIIGANAEKQDEDKVFDIILDWGIAPYQETENIEFNSVKFPYKCYTWAYTDSEILSPIDDAIDPQRFINRVWSMAMHQISTSRGSGTVYDKDMLGDMTEEEFLANVNQSKPIGIRTKGLGVQNAVGSYDNTIKNGTQILFNIIEAMKSSVQRMTGVNEALKGESTGSDQLVGVTQLMIQRGSLMQEPFYNAVTQIFKQCYDSIATVGKRIYCDDTRHGAIAVGDDDLEVIRITKEMRLEDFRVFIKRENADEILTNAADQMLLTLKQLMLIDDARFANLWGRSTPDDVAKALREYASEKEEITRMQANTQQQQQAQQQQMVDGMIQEQQRAEDEKNAREDIRHLTELQAENKIEAMKGIGKLAGKNPTADKLLIKNAENLQNQ